MPIHITRQKTRKPTYAIYYHKKDAEFKRTELLIADRA